MLNKDIKNLNLKKGQKVKITYLYIADNHKGPALKTYKGIVKKCLKNNGLKLYQVVKRERIENHFPLDSKLVIKLEKIIEIHI